MVVTKKENNVKVYQEVLEQIRLFIDQHNLSPGDRLPSERYLAETLKAGRSSVREALRAIELLGLIETRKGEGTYLKAYQPYHSVELLSSFILRESKKKEELIELKKLLEKHGLSQIIHVITEGDLQYLKQVLQKYREPKERHYYFFYKILQLTNNDLLIKVWQLIEEFSSSTNTIFYNQEMYKIILDLLKTKDKEKVESYVENLYEAEIKSR